VFALIGGVAHLAGITGNRGDAPWSSIAPMGIAQLLYGFVYICLGAWTRKAGDSFHTVTATEGADIPHLMDGLSNLRKIYTVIYAIIVIGLILWLVFAVIFLIGAFTSK
jgi:hypothetical protein